MDDVMFLRKLLFMSHPCPGRYGDDGEMQCGACRVDFKRDAPELIERRMIEAAFRKVGEPLNCPCGDDECGDAMPRRREALPPGYDKPGPDVITVGDLLGLRRIE